jgi:hypothetical protein
MGVGDLLFLSFEHGNHDRSPCQSDDDRRLARDQGQKKNRGREVDPLPAAGTSRVMRSAHGTVLMGREKPWALGAMSHPRGHTADRPRLRPVVP